MINETDIAIDNLAEEFFHLLDRAIEDISEDLIDEHNIAPELMSKVISSFYLTRAKAEEYQAKTKEEEE